MISDLVLFVKRIKVIDLFAGSTMMATTVFVLMLVGEENRLRNSFFIHRKDDSYHYC
jgi:hypothetical protein